jgi:hypothetical protein
MQNLVTHLYAPFVQETKAALCVELLVVEGPSIPQIGLQVIGYSLRGG